MKLFIFFVFFLVSNCNSKDEEREGNDLSYQNTLDSTTEATDQEVFQHENNIKLAEINEEQSNKIDELENQKIYLSNQLDNETQKMFIYGSKRQLIENGILERGGLFSSRHISQNLNLTNFERISLDRVEICLNQNINKLFPERKDSSYYISGNCLYITNIDEFWELGKILVIETE